MKKTLALIALFTLSINIFAGVENESQFIDTPYYDQIVDSYCLDCGPNEGWYEMISIDQTSETAEEICFDVVILQTWDDDYGPVNYIITGYKQEVDSDNICFAK